MLRCILAFAVIFFAEGRVTVLASDNNQRLDLLQNVWQKKRQDTGSVQYEFAGVETTWDRTDSSNTSPTRQQIVGKGVIRCSNFASAFDCSRQNGQRTVIVVNGKAFHFCKFEGSYDGEPTVGTPTIRHSTTVECHSDLLYMLPITLAHGIVPLDPLRHSDYFKHMKSHGQSKEPISIPYKRDQAITISNSKGRRKTTIKTNREGMTTSYRATFRHEFQLDVRNAYDPKDRLKSFTVIEFDSRGRILRRVDADIRKLKTIKEPWDTEFVTPKSRGILEEELTAKLDDAVRVSPIMALDELAACLEDAFGGQLAVRVVHEAFETPVNYPKEDFVFSEGTESIETILFSRFRQNGTDFRFSHNGLEIVPRHVAWESAEVQEYVPEMHNLDGNGMRDLLYNAAILDDWSDVGGSASIETDSETGNIVILHGQSDHLRFSRALKAITQGRKDD